MYIHNTLGLLCIISPLHEITRKVDANAASMGGMVNLTYFYLITAVISLSQFFFF